MKQEAPTSKRSVSRSSSLNAVTFQEDFRKMNRNEFLEVYLFFDYDGHNNNLLKGKKLNDLLRQMLETFDNETENVY